MRHPQAVLMAAASVLLAAGTALDAASAGMAGAADDPARRAQLRLARAKRDGAATALRDAVARMRRWYPPGLRGPGPLADAVMEAAERVLDMPDDPGRREALWDAVRGWQDARAALARRPRVRVGARRRV